jgi:hypothetical protein
MLLPFADCDDPDPPDHGCGWLFGVGSEILATALSGLVPFLPPEDCESRFDAFVTMGPPVAEFHYDGLSVNLITMGAEGRDAEREQRGTGCGPRPFPRLRAQWGIELWENCYPAMSRADDGRIEVPDPQTITAVTEHVYAHGIAIYNAVLVAIAEGTMDMPHQIDRVYAEPLQPLGPEGAAVGWRFRVNTVIGA